MIIKLIVCIQWVKYHFFKNLHSLRLNFQLLWELIQNFWALTPSYNVVLQSLNQFQGKLRTGKGEIAIKYNQKEKKEENSSVLKEKFIYSSTKIRLKLRKGFKKLGYKCCFCHFLPVFLHFFSFLEIFLNACPSTTNYFPFLTSTVAT